MLAGQIAVIMSAIFGLVAPILNKGKNKIAAIVSLFAGALPYLSILAFEGKIQFPDSVDFLWWVFLIASGPAFILCAILYSKLKSKKARNAAFIGAVIGTGTSIYMWTCLAGFGV
jgi:cyanate permease